MTHTSTEQPEALRLAKELRYCKVMFISEVASDFESAAALLERLHARVQELEASQARVPLTEFIEKTGSVGFQRVRAGFKGPIRWDIEFMTHRGDVEVHAATLDEAIAKAIKRTNSIK